MRGRVTSYNDRNGYGFIAPDDGSDSVFVHATELLEPVTPGDSVVFDVMRTAKGPAALRVSKVGYRCPTCGAQRDELAQGGIR